MGTLARSSFTPPILDNARDLLSRYDVLFCDIWGVVHDGVRALAASNDALVRFRAGGGTVVLVSNAPAPADGVAKGLSEKHVARDTYDAIVSSGEQALNYIRATGFQRVHRIGPGVRDDLFFQALALPDTALAACDAIACTGLENENVETGEHYRARLLPAATRGIPFVCANPDLVVHVGDRLLPCAGAIGAVYEDLGGPVVWCGKPHASAYQLALAKGAALRGGPIDAGRILAIGDAVRTDLAGAQMAGIDGLFITSGIHRDEVMTHGRIDASRLADLLTKAGIGATAAMTYLTW